MQLFKIGVLFYIVFWAKAEVRHLKPDTYLTLVTLALNDFQILKLLVSFPLIDSVIPRDLLIYNPSAMQKKRISTSIITLSFQVTKPNIHVIQFLCGKYL